MTQAAIDKLTTHKTVIKTERTLYTTEQIALFGLSIGEVIDESYRLIELIGQGGMGLVFLAEHVSLERPCALKILAPSVFSETSWILFQNEAKIIAGLNHPSICEIYDLGIHKGQLPFYAMEYLPGETLEQLLMKQGTITLGAALEIFIKLTDGLSYAHERGVIHKDIKPANIMLVPTKENSINVVLLDFGIAELNAPDKSATKIEDALGTALYMSPERFENVAVDGRSDLYSIGCSLFEALAGSLPFDGGSVEHIKESHMQAPIPLLRERTGNGFPIEIEAAIKKCLAKDPEERYQSARELNTDLKDILEKQPIRYAVAEIESVGTKAAEEAVLQPRKKIPFAVILILLIGLTSISIFVYRSTQTPVAQTRTTETTNLEELEIVNNTESASPVTSELIDIGDKTLEFDDKQPTTMVWQCDIKHPLFGEGTALYAVDKVKFVSKKEFQIAIIPDNKNPQTTCASMERQGALKAEWNSSKYIAKSDRMYRGIKVKKEGTEKIADLDCTRYRFTVPRNGMKGQFWTTSAFNTRPDVAKLWSMVCESPTGYGVPVKLVCTDAKSKLPQSKLEIMSATQRALTEDAFYLKKLKRDRLDFDSEKVEYTADGGTVTKSYDGTIETRWKDGTFKVEKLDKSGFIQQPDGSVEHWGDYDDQNYKQTFTSDGSKRYVYKDGTDVTENKNRTFTYKNADGSVSTWKISSIADQEIDYKHRKWPDISWQVDTIGREGHTTKKVKTNPPHIGAKVLWHIIELSKLGR